MIRNNFGEALADVLVFVFLFIITSAGTCQKQVSCDAGKPRIEEVRLEGAS